MLFTTDNPRKLITHNVISHNPFTVEFISLANGATAIEKYAIPLTKKEIEAEYDYVMFSVATPSHIKTMDDVYKYALNL